MLVELAIHCDSICIMIARVIAYVASDDRHLSRYNETGLRHNEGAQDSLIRFAGPAVISMGRSAQDGKRNENFYGRRSCQRHECKQRQRDKNHEAVTKIVGCTAVSKQTSYSRNPGNKSLRCRAKNSKP